MVVAAASPTKLSDQLACNEAKKANAGRRPAAGTAKEASTNAEVNLRRVYYDGIKSKACEHQAKAKGLRRYFNEQSNSEILHHLINKEIKAVT
jgi:hypothetical protein